MTGRSVIIEARATRARHTCRSYLAASLPAGRIPEVEKLIREAIEFHIEGIRAGGEAIPPPTASGALVVDGG